ncbi:hypothetical protein [Ideonella margarita]|uniref:Uncharacterized protein n=1 Tax=Ideonella margarita TaxID=2984191 RepID=A0ABU9C7G9_9BURK
MADSALRWLPEDSELALAVINAEGDTLTLTFSAAAVTRASGVHEETGWVRPLVVDLALATAGGASTPIDWALLRGRLRSSDLRTADGQQLHRLMLPLQLEGPLQWQLHIGQAEPVVLQAGSLRTRPLAADAFTDSWAC